MMRALKTLQNMLVGFIGASVLLGASSSQGVSSAVASFVTDDGTRFKIEQQKSNLAFIWFGSAPKQRIDVLSEQQGLIVFEYKPAEKPGKTIDILLAPKINSQASVEVEDDATKKNAADCS